METPGNSLSWRVLIDPPYDGATNMAIDEALLETCASSQKLAIFPVLRFYRWSIPTLSIGYNQKIDEAVDRELCRREGIDIIRRQTGGKAVLHDRELTYSLTAHFSSSPFGALVTENYRIISEALREGLNLIGIDASIASEELPAYSAFSKGHCFSSLSRYELSYRGRKIVGSAQRRRRKGFLQHGSILLDSQMELFARVTRSEAFLGEKVNFVTIKEAAGREVSFEELSHAIMKGFEKKLRIHLLKSTLTEVERSLAERLKKDKYKSSLF